VGGLIAFLCLPLLSRRQVDRLLSCRPWLRNRRPSRVRAAPLESFENDALELRSARVGPPPFPFSRRAPLGRRPSAAWAPPYVLFADSLYLPPPVFLPSPNPSTWLSARQPLSKQVLYVPPAQCSLPLVSDEADARASLRLHPESAGDPFCTATGCLPSRRASLLPFSLLLSASLRKGLASPGDSAIGTDSLLEAAVFRSFLRGRAHESNYSVSRHFCSFLSFYKSWWVT